MSRKTARVTITAQNRDQGKTFELTEMDAAAGEDWAWRALFAMGKSNPDIPLDSINAGWAVVALVGIRALLSAPYADAKPLLEEMFACVQIVQPNGVRALVTGDIEEISTRLFLRDEVFKLHANFSFAEILSTFQSVYMPAGTEPDPSESNTQTFGPESA